ncbi:hypothetical protein [Streptomyces sp. Inha503]|uniref:hypothetical protein n=1 Tax=Streptomyces sp. Inha503 TaxID=3383314 RepID=UPI0039A23940
MSWRRHVARVPAGGERIARRVGPSLAAWCRKSYRHDLTGWKAGAGPALRALLLLGLAAGLAWLVRTWPKLLWVLVPGALLAAWYAGRTAHAEDAEDAPANESEKGPSAVDPDAVRQLLADLIGDRPGVHLSAVLAHLQERGLGEGWEVAELRARLEVQGVPVRRSVKVAGRVAYGVHRDDLPTPAETPSPGEAAERAA